MAAMAGRYSPTEDELAAALAAVEMLLRDEPDRRPFEERAGWRASALLSGQAQPPRPSGQPPTWGNVERAGAASWTSFTGITGL